MQVMEEPMAEDRLVTSVSEAKANIDRYAKQLAKSPELQAVMSYARAWHGYREPGGKWRIAPSKFVGYAGNEAAAYLSSQKEHDGRRTERALAAWSEKLEAGSAAYEDFEAGIRKLFSLYGKTPNKLFRMHALRLEQSAAERTATSSTDRADMRVRITVDPRICGGRPVIRGMRIRVGDILDMLAAGASRREILADYPYLEDEDISASLAYAAETAGHRVVSVA
jgi:uncharacterized protein (DUF433 family)